MKFLMRSMLLALICLPFWIQAQHGVSYRLEYDLGTQTYTFSINSNIQYNPPISWILNSSQVTIVVPQIPGGWQVTNLQALVPSAPIQLGWTFQYLNGMTYSLPNDYLFFTPSNGGVYTPFLIPANTWLPLFSFQTSSGCVGDLSLYDIATDPLNQIQNINAGHNIVIFPAGQMNIFTGSASGNVSCVAPCAANAGTLGY